MIPRWALITGVLAIAAAHTGLFLALFGYSFGAREVPSIIGIAINILGAPLMYLFPLRSKVCEPFTCWWGLDENLFIGLAVLNGLLWGMTLMWALQVWARRRRHAA